MKTITIRLPEPLLADIDLEARTRNISRSVVIRERVQRQQKRAVRPAAHLEPIDDLIGSVNGLPADLSSRIDWYLQATGYGRDRR